MVRGLFPRTVLNQPTGRRQSNNALQQPLFSQRDPYATGSAVIAQLARGIATSRPGRFLSPSIADQLSPGVQQPTVASSVAAQPETAISSVSAQPVSAQPTSLAGLQGLEAFAGLTPEELERVRLIGAAPLNPDLDIRGAAQVLAGALRGTPGVTFQGQLDLARGFIPNLSDVSQSFLTHADPILTRALAGLYQSAGVVSDPQDVEFLLRQRAPTGFTY